jgi:formylglycine-generating enzyme required for sulfatase activity
MLTNLFKRKEKEPIPDFKEVVVTLKPIFGIRPGIYLTVIYGLIALIIIFLLFFLPGICADGTYLNFSSAPVKAGVWIDGKKAGVTPCEILVPRGPHEITVERPFYKPVTMKKEVSNFIFALPFLPKKDYIGTSLEVSDSKALARNAYKDFSEWALVEEFSAAYQYPPILCEAVKCIYSSPTDETYAVLKDLLVRALPSVHNRELASDFFRALLIVETKGRSLTPSSMFRIIAEAGSYLSADDNIPSWIYTILPKRITGTQEAKKSDAKAQRIPSTKDELGEAPWFKQYITAYREFISRYTPQTGPRIRAGFPLAGSSFLYIPEGSFMMGKTDSADLLNLEYLDLFPHPVRVKGFYLAETEVANWQYASFLEENPEWRLDNKAKLISLHLVDEEYLSGWKNNTYPAGKAALPVTYVSAFAAEAYCAWLTRKAEGIVPGFVARLPYEAEWEWAAAGGYLYQFKVPGSLFFEEQAIGPRPVGNSGRNIFGLADMAGNVFEWCKDWYAKAAPLLSSKHAERYDYTLSGAYTDGGEKVVRGGSWAVPIQEIEVYTRGSQSPDLCTPFLGFRPAIAER